MSDCLLFAVALSAVLLLLHHRYMVNNTAESFSLSNKPMSAENSLLNRNPFDDIDYITPTFTMLN